MDCKIKAEYIKGTVKIPSSKSFAHRALIAAALSDKPTVLEGCFEGDDIKATINCLNSLGASIIEDKNRNLMVSPIVYGKIKTAELFAGESGSTLRFLIPLSASIGIESTFYGNGRLGQRPIEELLDLLRIHGVTIKSNNLPFTVKGNLESGNYELSGKISSQYVTGLLMSLPLLKGDSTIKIIDKLESESYVNITLKVLSEFGIRIIYKENTFYIKGNQKYVSPAIFLVEGDWSSACFFAVAGVLGGDITLTGLNANSIQGDKIIINLLQNAKGQITANENGIRFRKSNLEGISFSASDCPDIVPVMAAALARAKGVSEIKDIGRLRHKESDRLEAVIAMLSSLGITAKEENNTLFIYGGKINSGKVFSYNDHRIAMSAAVAICGTNEKIHIEGADSVNKSFPKFYDYLEKLGGKINVV